MIDCRCENMDNTETACYFQNKFEGGKLIYIFLHYVWWMVNNTQRNGGHSIATILLRCDWLLN